MVWFHKGAQSDTLGYILTFPLTCNESTFWTLLTVSFFEFIFWRRLVSFFVESLKSNLSFRLLVTSVLGFKAGLNYLISKTSSLVQGGFPRFTCCATPTNLPMASMAAYPIYSFTFSILGYTRTRTVECGKQALLLIESE